MRLTTSTRRRFVAFASERISTASLFPDLCLVSPFLLSFFCSVCPRGRCNTQTQQTSTPGGLKGEERERERSSHRGGSEGEIRLGESIKSVNLKCSSQSLRRERSAVCACVGGRARSYTISMSNRPNGFDRWPGNSLPSAFAFCAFASLADTRSAGAFLNSSRSTRSIA